jgi:hypothetical protein
MVESAKPPNKASRTLAGSAPPRSASNTASATVTMVLATIIWLTSLES